MVAHQSEGTQNELFRKLMVSVHYVDFISIKKAATALLESAMQRTSSL